MEPILSGSKTGKFWLHQGIQFTTVKSLKIISCSQKTNMHFWIPSKTHSQRNWWSYSNEQKRFLFFLSNIYINKGDLAASKRCFGMKYPVKCKWTMQSSQRQMIYSLKGLWLVASNINWYGILVYTLMYSLQMQTFFGTQVMWQKQLSLREKEFKIPKLLFSTKSLRPLN